MQDLRGAVAKAAAKVEDFHLTVDGARLDPALSACEMRARVREAFGEFETGIGDDQLLDSVNELMREGNLHTTHPRGQSTGPASVHHQPHHAGG